MTMRIDENPRKEDGECHEYQVSFSPVESKRDGKVIELQGMEAVINKTFRNGGKELGLYGLMSLTEAEKIYKSLGEAIKILKK